MAAVKHQKRVAPSHTANIREYFDSIAPGRRVWVERNQLYYQDIERLVTSIVPGGSSVLEVGSGTGDLLAATRPARGVGIDVSPGFVELARQRHPELTFVEMDVEALDLREKFDYVILAGTLSYLGDIQTALSNLRQVCTPRTRLVIAFHNYLWEPVLRFGELIGQRMPVPAQSWLAEGDIENLLEITGFRVVKRGRRLLLPRAVPGLTTLVNRYLARLPLINPLCLTVFHIARLDAGAHVETGADSPYTCSVVIPARNEKGNIETALRRMPRMGRHTEIVFVEGGSTDGTYEEIERVAAQYGQEWDIKVLKQRGRGKGDAVRQGFDAASGDILMILDADLTVAPEDLTKFFDVLASGRGEFANGCRLIYPSTREAMPLRNTMANKIFGVIFTYLLGQRFKDTLCGTKALWRQDYQRIVAGRAFFGDFDPFGDFDLLFGASKLNLQITEVPIRYAERSYGRSNIQHMRSGLILLRMCLYASRKIKFV